MANDLRFGKLAFYRRVFCVLTLAFGLGALPVVAQQEQQDQPANAGPTAADQSTPAEASQGPPPFVPLPATLTLKAGTVVTVRISQLLSSDQNQPGDGFSAELQQPLVTDGWVVARRGQTVLGRVAVAQKAGRVKGVSQLGIELTQLILVDGQQLPIRTQLMQTSAGTSHGRDAEAIGTTAGLGAAIGAAAAGGEGAGIGAAAGAAAGITGVLLTRGRPTVIPPETVLTFQLESPLTFSTQQSRVAFRPVSQQDYDSRDTLHRRTDRFAVPPYPPPPPYWTYSPWAPYPFPFFFSFGYYGYGHGGYYHH